MDLKDHIVPDGWYDEDGDLGGSEPTDPHELNGYTLWSGEQGGKAGSWSTVVENLANTADYDGPKGEYEWPFSNGLPMSGSPGFSWHWVRVNGKDYTVVFPHFISGPGGWQPSEVWEGLYDTEALIWLQYELTLWLQYVESPGGYDALEPDEEAVIIEWLATH